MLIGNLPSDTKAQFLSKSVEVSRNLIVNEYKSGKFQIEKINFQIRDQGNSSTHVDEK